MPSGAGGGKRSVQRDLALHHDGSACPCDLEGDRGRERAPAGERSPADPHFHPLLHFALGGDAEALEQLTKRSVKGFFIHQGVSPPSLIRSIRRPCCRGL